MSDYYQADIEDIMKNLTPASFVSSEEEQRTQTVMLFDIAQSLRRIAYIMESKT